MYQVSIFNNSVETVIHYPSPEAPKVNKLPLKEKLSEPDNLSFSLYSNNPGYNLIIPLVTKVKVIDTRDDSVRFVGRILPRTHSMDGQGMFSKEVVCEGALGYLNDTHTRRWNFTNQTPTQILTYLLNQHNSKVDTDRKIYLGTVEKAQPITIDTNYETTLNAIITKIKNVLGGDIRVRETSGVLYLDYLLGQGVNNSVGIRLGYNMKELLEEYDPIDVVTRLIPLGYGEGINQLNIKSVNSNIEYVEDAAAITQYGVIEGVINNTEIQNAYTLMQYGNTVLQDKKQPRVTLNTKMLDLSVLPQYNLDKYSLGDTLNIINDVMNINVYARVIESDTDLLQPQNRDNVISTKPIRLTDQIIDLKQRNLSLENAPQGSTCIFALPKAENADSSHPVTFDLDIPKETININRVYLNLHGRKYRANSKGTSSGGGTSSTTSSGGGTTTTSASGGGYSNNISSTPASDYDPAAVNLITTNDADAVTPHRHYLPNGMLAMIYNHTHNIAINISSHIHNITISAHSHAITLGNHIHDAIYGIFESTYPYNVKIKVNGTDISVNYGDGTNPFDEYDIDITSYVTVGNNKIEITTEQNGRIDAVVYSQIFIQAK